MPAFFRQNPETLKIAEKEIRNGNPATASLLGGLASSGNPAAQAVLVKLTLDDIFGVWGHVYGVYGVRHC